MTAYFFSKRVPFNKNFVLDGSSLLLIVSFVFKLLILLCYSRLTISVSLLVLSSLNFNISKCSHAYLTHASSLRVLFKNKLSVKLFGLRKVQQISVIQFFPVICIYLYVKNNFETSKASDDIRNIVTSAVSRSEFVQSIHMVIKRILSFHCTFIPIKMRPWLLQMSSSSQVIKYRTA